MKYLLLVYGEEEKMRQVDDLSWHRLGFPDTGLSLV
jgi:hypothetical protein